MRPRRINPVNAVETVVEYHARTKHHPQRYAASLGYMDWATQPDPFRIYAGAQRIELALPDIRAKPTYAELFDVTAAKPLTLDTLSIMLRYALGLAAIKCMGSECWALRCNASSGNLHPTEGYVILPPTEGVNTRSVIAHYAPKSHSLEILHSFETTFWETLPASTLLFGLTSIVWREAWKYGERAFRYTQLDAGHALRSVTVASRLNGWHTRLLDAVDPEAIELLLGLGQSGRFHKHEEEIPDALLLVSPMQTSVKPDLTPLLSQCHSEYTGKANLLSPSHHPWEAITLVERATQAASAPLPTQSAAPLARECDESAEAIILKRRSARAMDFGRTMITRQALLRMLQSTQTAFAPFEPAATLVLFIHDVEGLAPGLYLYALNPKYLETFRERMRDNFSFDPVADNLYLLETGDFKPQAKFICCSQDIASDGAFSFGMLCEFAPQLAHYGPQRYKSLYWECGAIGQQLYLEATSLGLSATGIGCFLDDVMHRLLGLEGNDFQSLYHFTVGRAIADLRLQTKSPYAQRSVNPTALQ